MQNNQIGSISMLSAKKKRSRFNFAHDVNTTYSFGDTQPLQCKLLIPGTKSTCSVESLVRLAPMLAPTFGRIKFKQWHSFIPISDLLENFNSLLAQEPITFGSNTYVPQQLPNVSLKVLSLMILIGAKFNVYRHVSGTPSDNNLSTSYYKCVNSTNSGSDNAPMVIEDFGNKFLYAESNAWNFTGGQLMLSALGSAYAGSLDSIPVGVPNLGAALGSEANTGSTSPNSTGSWTADDIANARKQGYDLDDVELDSADCIIPVTLNNHAYMLAFRLSAFGKRIRKILLGCGYQINFSADTKVSLLPLFAYYKCYFDIFGLNLLNAWETTDCRKTLKLIDNNNITNFDNVIVNYSDVGMNADLVVSWIRFVQELGNCWVTDDSDFVNAHTATTAVSPYIGLQNRFVDVVERPNVGSYDSSSGEPDDNRPNPVNGHGLITGVEHGQLDAEYLKRLYRWTNRNTIAGRKIADLLRAQGLGDYVDKCKSNFIGYEETIVTISDVVSQADTFSDGNGAFLGEYAGRGLKYNETKSFTFENDEYGFWVCLSAIVPQSGYAQQVDPSLLAVDKLGLYNPEFDALGMEATRKLEIVGSEDWKDSNIDADPDATFGFIPRYSGFKIAPNVQNGDFNLRSTRNNYQPYTLDKLISVGERYVSAPYARDGVGFACYDITKLLPLNKLPTASPIWRYNSRYQFLGNYNRIFVETGMDVRLPAYLFSDDISNALKYIFNEYDNFMVHNIINMQSFSPMLPISDSFETDDEGKTNMSMKKA